MRDANTEPEAQARVPSARQVLRTAAGRESSYPFVAPSLRRFVALLTLSLLAPAAFADTTAKATIDIAADVREKRMWPEVLGINLAYGGAAALATPKAMDAVRKIAIRSIRFPNGCEADLPAKPPIMHRLDPHAAYLFRFDEAAKAAKAAQTP